MSLFVNKKNTVQIVRKAVIRHPPHTKKVFSAGYLHVYLIQLHRIYKKIHSKHGKRPTFV